MVVLMTASESEAIDKWSFENRIRSKGEAIRRLCHAALTIDRLGDEVRESFDTSASKLIDELLGIRELFGEAQSGGDAEQIESQLLRRSAKIIDMFFGASEYQSLFIQMMEALGTAKTYNEAVEALEHYHRLTTEHLEELWSGSKAEMLKK